MAVREPPIQKRFAVAHGDITMRTRPPPYRGRGSQSLKTLYDADHVDSRQGGRFRWLFSTCLAATVGAVAIIVIIQGSAEQDAGDGLLPALRKFNDGPAPTPPPAIGREIGGLKWAVAKTDRLKLTTGALSTRYIIHDMQKQRRGGREYIHAKPYARIVARLAPVASDVAQSIPPFNPFKLYAGAAPASGSADPDDKAGSGLSRSDVAVQVVELLGGILPGEDGQELDTTEVSEMIDRSSASEPSAGEIGFPLDGNGTSVADPGDPAAVAADDRRQNPAKVANQPNTTVIPKVRAEAEDANDELETGEVTVVSVGQTDTLVKILTRSGAEAWQARAMMEAAQDIFPETALQAGQEVRITLVQSLTDPEKKEPARFSVFSDGHGHLVTVSRNAAGEFVASATPQIEQELSANSSDINGTQATSLYASLYNAGQIQNLSPDTILQIMRIHAFETDFRRRLRPGDAVEMFFDMQGDSLAEGVPGELLFTSITSGGDTFRFYRYRAEDGSIDYYDADGNNSRRFLMRKPVRGDDVRLTSGYGVRFHPLLNERKMHTGVDWAASPGTPIVAAGNGTIEELGRKGQYGKYIRIRHANGYQTAYGHMREFATSLAEGTKVRQGQVIGYVGTTGLSSGPHLHFEVLVNSRFVDPMSIEVPRERKLTGADFKEFQAERLRIDDLMRRSPVMTNSK